MRFTATVFMALLLAMAAQIAAGAEKQPHGPNIIFICTDDQAAWTVGAAGNRESHTPNMDGLVQEGATLTNSFVTTPVCSPSRASLMTSRYASEFGILDFIPHPKHRLYKPTDKIGLDPQSVTFAEVLKESGYQTGLVGKWHLGDWTKDPTQRFHPNNQGFQYFMGLTGGGTTPDNPILEIDGQTKQFNGLTTDILTDHALEFLKSNADHPFLLCLHYRAPHGRWLPVAEEDWAPYANLDPTLPNPNYPDLDVQQAKNKMREYLASTSGVDRNLGRLLQLLDELKLTEKTVVIFTSDHGYNMGHNGIRHKGNGVWMTKTTPPSTKNIRGSSRPNLYDTSLRVPAIVKWPGVVQPGTVITETTSNLDWYPTIVEIAGGSVPQDQIIRGRSLVPLLKGETVENWNNDFYAEYSMINYCRAYMRCYRTPRWKLVRDFLNPERDELYDLGLDPQENINMIHDSRVEVQQVVDRLHQQIIANMRAINDPLLKDIESEEEGSR